MSVHSGLWQGQCQLREERPDNDWQLRDEGDTCMCRVHLICLWLWVHLITFLTLSSIDLILMSSCKGPLSSFRSRNVEFGIEFEFGFELRFERRIKQGHLLQYNIISLTSWQSVTVEWRGRLWVGWVRTWYVLRLHRSDGSDNALALRQSGSKQSDISYLNKIYWKIKPLLSSFRDIIRSCSVTGY